MWTRTLGFDSLGFHIWDPGGLVQRYLFDKLSTLAYDLCIFPSFAISYFPVAIKMPIDYSQITMYL